MVVLNCAFGNRCIKTNSMQKSLYAVGGLRLFLPLLLQVDLPYCPADGAPLLYTADPLALIQTVCFCLCVRVRV